MLTYPFTQEEFEAAADKWGCNCGPSALAFALQVNLDRVRPLLPQFDERRYTNPTMMRQALTEAGQEFRSVNRPAVEDMFSDCVALVRIQWTGSWTEPGANPKWAYRQTHWIATWLENLLGEKWVFDCNGGIQVFELWDQTVVPALTSMYPRADGGWFPTHVWRLDRNPNTGS